MTILTEETVVCKACLETRHHIVIKICVANIDCLLSHYNICISTA